ncbi:dihydrofolate reductase family protein [Streptomyces hawaiiensis]|uniref:dihydrofolate reductase family protein n=1 Tax=Streptomyces hawaiiensis TaxID=67305 RepID=UPI00365A7A2F
MFSPAIGRQLLERGLIDEIDLHSAPVLLGDGTRLFDTPRKLTELTYNPYVPLRVS